jgi:hypothetical protein
MVRLGYGVCVTRQSSSTLYSVNEAIEEQMENRRWNVATTKAVGSLEISTLKSRLWLNVLPEVVNKFDTQGPMKSRDQERIDGDR